MAGEVPAKAVQCAACGAPFTLRGFATTRTVACEYCGSLFDTSKPEWQLVEKVERRRAEAPLWPLGTRARWEGHRFDLVGWMRRYVSVDGHRYHWEEHLFFSPFHGFRYLLYQDGHFTLATPLPGVPQIVSTLPTRCARYEGVAARHFTTGEAIVEDVIGEFPWRVARGDRATATDYVAPPFVLSEEKDAGESVWSRGVYMTQAEVFAAVANPRRFVSSPRGVAPNQPNPGDAARWAKPATLVALALWALLSLVYVFRCSGAIVLDATVHSKGAVAAVGTETEPAALVFPFQLASSRSPANVEVTVLAPVDNNWAFCACALVDTRNEKAYPFGAEVSYYHGVDDGESWSEGSQETEVLLGGVPDGDFVLEVERDDGFKGDVRILVRRDVALARYPILALIIIGVFPVILLARSRSFERRRWAESDHAP
jgi:hypothetical protein